MNWDTKNPELAGLWGNFTKEVSAHGALPAAQRFYVVLAAHIGASGSVQSFKNVLAEALAEGVPSEGLMEAVYQTIPYAGMAKTYDFIGAANEVFAARGIALPLAGQSTTTPSTRFEKGLAVQKSIFGAEAISSMRANAPAELKHVQDYLSANCFGDYYTRNGLDVPTRELVTFATIAAMGGAEPQLKAHIQANINVGNTKQNLLDAVTQMLPYMGYPRTLNALAAVNEIIK